MPHLYLPTDHTDEDLVLAADVAAAVSSADLYVTWTHEWGAGAPEIEAVVREERPPVQVNPFAELLVALFQGIATLWQSLTGPPTQRLAAVPAASAGRPQGEPQI